MQKSIPITGKKAQWSDANSIISATNMPEHFHRFNLDDDKSAIIIVLKQTL